MGRALGTRARMTLGSLLDSSLSFLGGGGHRAKLQQHAKPAPAERIPLDRWSEASSAAGTRRRLESLGRETILAARIAVDSGDNAASKGLVIDGKLEYQEPFF
jgi:hypothetical protein